MGETQSEADIGEADIPGDRGWAVRDEIGGGMRGGKKNPTTDDPGSKIWVRSTAHHCPRQGTQPPQALRALTSGSATSWVTR